MYNVNKRTIYQLCLALLLIVLVGIPLFTGAAPETKPRCNHGHPHNCITAPSPLPTRTASPVPTITGTPRPTLTPYPTFDPRLQCALGSSPCWWERTETAVAHTATAYYGP